MFSQAIAVFVDNGKKTSYLLDSQTIPFFFVYAFPDIGSVGRIKKKNSKKSQEVSEQEALVPQDDIIKKFIVDRLKIIAVAKKYISMPKVRAIPQMVSAPLNPILGLHCHAMKNKKANHSIEKDQNLGNEKRLIYKNPCQESGL